MALTITRGQIGVEDQNYIIGSSSTFERETSDGTETTYNRLVPTDVRNWGTEANSWADALNAAITAIGSNNVHLVVPVAQTLSAHLTVPANVILELLPGAIITTGAYNLTLNGHLIAGPYKIITWVVATGGTVSFNNNSYVYPQWFGALNDGTAATATKTAIIQCMSINTASDQEKPVILFPPGQYNVDGSLTTTEKDLHLKGAFANATKESASESATAIFWEGGSGKIIDIDNARMENLYLKGEGTATHGIDGENLDIYNCRIDQCGVGVQINNTGTSNKISECRLTVCDTAININNHATNTYVIDLIEKCYFEDSTNYDLVLVGGGMFNILHNLFYNGDDKGISIQGNGTYNIDGNQFSTYDNTMIETTTGASTPRVNIVNNFAFDATTAITFCEHNRGFLRASNNTIIGYTGAAGMSKAFYLKDGFTHAAFGQNTLQTANSAAFKAFEIETEAEAVKVCGNKDFVESYSWAQATGSTKVYIPVYGNEAESDYVLRQYFVRSIKAIVVAAMTVGGTDPTFSLGYDILGGAEDVDAYATVDSIDSASEGSVITMDTYVSAAARTLLAAGITDDNKVIELDLTVQDWTGGGPVLFYVSIGCIEWSDLS